VANEAGELYGPFGTELMDVHGTLWTPSVYGERITLIAATPATTGGASFRIASVAELFELDAQGQPKLEANPKNDLPCAEDAQCIGTSSFSTIEETQSAIGSYTFVSGGSSFVCSGGLVNDTDTETFIPYFLTANHCLSTGAEASTVEVVWDYYASSCNGSAPSRGSLPRSNGATLLRTGEFADFTFLRLSNVPGGRWFMGWETGRSAISNGTVLHRVSHPGGGPQVYSRTAVSSPPPFSCSGLPTSNYIYSSQLQGGTAGGSSGAPVLLDNGRIVGQFFGDCGENIDDNCDYDNLAVDGALASFFGEIATYLETDSSGAADLAVTEVTGPGGAVAPGASFDVATTVENIGGQPSNAYRLTFYLSSDRNIGSSDRSLGFVDRESLGPGERHARVTTVTAPGDLAPGRYYVGVVISGGDSNASNDTRSDATPLDVGGGGGSVSVTPALNGAWFNPPTAGQGLLIEVYPGIGKVFMAWFTFDTTQPGNAASATIGAAGHRWLTGLGDIDGNRVQFDVALTQGALFNQVEPAAETTTGFGTVVIEFASCGSATLTYIFPGAGRSGSIDLQRITSDSVSNCQTIQGIYGQ
ncbi:MAG: trypsin-like peptidase domain-containing protein, partial [Pseudomonadota bacterium]